MSGDEGKTPDNGADVPGTDPDESAEETPAGKPDESVDEGTGGGGDASVADDAGREPTDPHVDDGSGQQPPEEAEEGQGGETETLADDVDDQRATDQAAEPSDSTAGSSGGQVDTSEVRGGQVGSTGASGGHVETTVETSQGESVETAVVKEGTKSDEPLVSAIVSFLIPGVGNMINGQTDRGLAIFLIWITWFFGVGVIGIGIFGFFISSILALFTLGISTLLWFLLVVAFIAIEFAIHVIAAIDAYEQSEIVDSITVKVNGLRGS